MNLSPEQIAAYSEAGAIITITPDGSMRIDFSAAQRRKDARERQKRFRENKKSQENNTENAVTSRYIALPNVTTSDQVSPPSLPLLPPSLSPSAPSSDSPPIIPLSPTPSNRSADGIADAPTKDFMAWWSVYPKKEGRKACWDHWKKLKPKPDIEEIIAGIERFKRSEKWAKGFIMDPINFLKGRRWEDEIGESKLNGQTNGHRHFAPTGNDWDFGFKEQHEDDLIFNERDAG